MIRIYRRNRFYARRFDAARLTLRHFEVCLLSIYPFATLLDLLEKFFFDTKNYIINKYVELLCCFD